MKDFSQLQFQAGVLQQRIICNTLLYKREKTQSWISDGVRSAWMLHTVLQTLFILCSGLSDLVCFDFCSILSSLFHDPLVPSLPLSTSILPSQFCSLLGNETLPHNGYTVRNIFEYTFRKHRLCHAAMIPNSNCLD